jgi:hypothetical protein
MVLRILSWFLWNGLKQVCLVLLPVLLLTLSASAQKTGFFDGLFTDNYKLEVKMGTGAVISPVPEKYLSNINGVNLPLMKSGFAGLLLAKKMVSGHVEMGYQFEFFSLGGVVEQHASRYNLQTTPLANNCLLIYNLKNIRNPRPQTNYFFYYKVGAISLKNVPRRIAEDGSVGEPEGDRGFLNNVAVGHGGGVGFNYQLNDQFSLTGTVELNRTSDLAADVYRVDKLFYHSGSSVNSYFTVSGGICYTFNLGTKEKKGSPHIHSETSQNKVVRYNKRNLKMQGRSPFAPDPGKRK